jgi:hypothetical protein
MTMFDLIRKLVKQPESNVSFDLDGLRERNETRIAQIKAEMGTKYILHPSHTKSRLDTPRPV